jgi:hypothetical protein
LPETKTGFRASDGGEQTRATVALSFGTNPKKFGTTPVDEKFFSGFGKTGELYAFRTRHEARSFY